MLSNLVYICGTLLVVSILVKELLRRYRQPLPKGVKLLPGPKGEYYIATDSVTLLTSRQAGHWLETYLKFPNLIHG